MKIILDTNKEREKRKEFYKKISKGLDVKPKKRTIYLSPESVSKVFSPERLRLISIIKEKKFESISELAKTLNRPFESVDRDIRYLTGLRLIKLEKRERNKIPIAQKISFVL